MDHQAPARDDVVSSSSPAPAQAVSAPTVSSPSTSPSSSTPVPQRNINPAESSAYATQAQTQAPQASQPYAQYPPANYPAYPYYGAGAAGAGGGAAADSAADAPPKKLAQRLDAGEEHWRWKISLRMFLIIVDIIGVGAAIGVTASGNSTEFYFADEYIIPFCLIPLGASLIWCILYVLVLFLRKPPRAMHPGVAVGCDLVLWLTLIFTTLFSVYALSMVSDLGSDGVIEEADSNGNYGIYTLNANGTWVYQITYANGYYYDKKRAAPTAPAIEVKVPIAIEATTTGFSTVTVPTTVSPVSSVVFVAPTPTEAPSLAAAKRAVDTSYSDIDSTTYSDYDYYTYSFDNYYDTSESSSSLDTSTSTSTGSTSLGSDLYLYTTSTRSYYRTTSAGEAFYATTTVAVVATVSRECSYAGLSSCAEEDALVNKMWRDKGRHLAMDWIVVVTQAIGILTHFALFVWACVDTHRRNRARRTDAIVAMNLLQDMRKNGYVMVPAAEATAAQNSQHGYGQAGFVPTGQAYTYPAGYTVAPQQPMSPGPESSSRAAEKAPAHHYA